MTRLPALYSSLPYCGPPAEPADLWARWNLDPWLLLALVAVPIVYGAATRSWKGPPERPMAFLAGWLIAALALTSPLCALSTALFSARVAQHMILAFGAAPLLAMGWPGQTQSGQTRSGQTRSGWYALAAAGAFAAALWIWHAPGPYDATFRSAVIYWAMHLSLIGAALWLWRALFAAKDAGIGGFIAAGALTSGQMGLLGALITFAPRPLYAPHLLTTLAWRLTPLEDQALGGAVMWVPAGILLAMVFALGFRGLLRRTGDDPIQAVV